MRATKELAGKQGFHSWLIFFYSSKLQSKSDQKLTCAKFPRPRSHLVILMFLSAFMTRAKMTISLRSNGQCWLSTSSSRRLTKVWSPGKLPASVSPRTTCQESRHSSPGTLLCAWQAHGPGTLWMKHVGLNKMAFLHEYIFLPVSIQPALLSTAFTTKVKSQITRKTLRLGKHIFECLEFSPGNFNTHERSPSNNATGVTLLESKSSWKLFPHSSKTKKVRVKWTELIMNHISLTRCGTLVCCYCFLLQMPKSKLQKPSSLIPTIRKLT